MLNQMKSSIMKTIGYVIAVFGGLSTLGALMGNHNPLGGIFFLVLGIFLITRAQQRAERKKAKNEWNNGNNEKI